MSWSPGFSGLLRTETSPFFAQCINSGLLTPVWALPMFNPADDLVGPFLVRAFGRSVATYGPASELCETSMVWEAALWGRYG